MHNSFSPNKCHRYNDADDRPVNDGEENLFSDPMERSPYENVLKKPKKERFDEKNKDFG